MCSSSVLAQPWPCWEKFFWRQNSGSEEKAAFSPNVTGILADLKMPEKHSLFMPFFHWRNIAFPAFCVLRVIHCLKTLAWKSFFSSNFIWRCDCREGLQSHRERQTSIQTSLPSHFLCSRDLENIGLSGKFLDTVGTHPECEPGYQRWQNSHFTLGWPYNGVA